MNRKLELTIGSLLLISLIFIVGTGLFNLSYNEDNTIQRLADAIEEMDIEYLEDHIVIEEIDEPLTSEQIAKIARVLKEEDFDIKTLKSLYVPTVKGRGWDATNELDDDEGSDNYIRLEKRGREKLIYDKYVLVLRPYNLIIESDFAGAEVFVDDVKAGTIDEDTMTVKIPHILPGRYEIRVSYEDDYFKAENSEVMDCLGIYNKDIGDFISLDAYYVEAYSNMEGAVLYIDGKKTDIELPDILGPIPTDSTIELQAKVEINGEVYESEKITTDSPYDLYCLSIDHEEDLNDNGDNYWDYDDDEDYDDYVSTDIEERIELEILQVMEDYLINLVDGINYNDTDYLSEVEPGSSLMDDQIKLIERLNEKGIKEHLLNYAVLDFKRISDTIYEVEVFEEHLLMYEDDHEKVVSNQWIYTVVFDGSYGPYLRDIRKAE